MSGEDQRWLNQCIEFATTLGQGGMLLGFPEYRPDLAKLVAHRLQLTFYDYRSEVMAAYGPDAASIELDSLDQTLGELAAGGGAVVFNVEALLATKSPEQREAWLTGLLRADWPHPMVIPLTLFTAEAGGLSQRILNFAPEDLPEQGLVSRLMH